NISSISSARPEPRRRPIFFPTNPAISVASCGSLVPTHPTGRSECFLRRARRLCPWILDRKFVCSLALPAVWPLLGNGSQAHGPIGTQNLASPLQFDHSDSGPASFSVAPAGNPNPHLANPIDTGTA